MLRAIPLGHTLIAAAAACVVGLTTIPASATVEGMLTSTVAYRHPEVEGYCYGSIPVSAMIGIPAASVVEGALAPAYVLRSGQGNGGFESVDIAGRTYVNINAVAEQSGIAHEYVNDAIDGQTLAYQAKLDVSALAAVRGPTLEGRRQTIVQVKLALLGMARSLLELSASGLFSLRVEIVGLPDQSDLDGARVFATTQYPYTAGSPLLGAYEAELLSQACSGDAAFGGKADDPGSDAATNSDSPPKPKKCSVAAVGTPNDGVEAAPWLLAAVLAVTRRRRRPA
jgi:MYXO-CTERM domain-containing protein